MAGDTPSAATPAGDPAVGARSSRRVLELLLSFTEDRPRASIAELASSVGVPLSTAYRYVALLRDIGLLEENERGIYTVTARVMGPARAAQIANSLSLLARPVMRRISDDVNETVMLMERIRMNAMCVEHIECSHPMRYAFRAGHQVPLGSGASGKLLLAALPEAERLEIIDRRARDDAQFAARRRALELELGEIAARGWATSSSEVEPGVWACSAAIRDGDRIVAGLSVAGPEARIDKRRREHILAGVRTSAAEVSELLASYRLPHETGVSPRSLF
jgi:DNA-binding IclR family transcriptional regulator